MQAEMSREVTCSRCGTAAGPGDKFCKKCGQSLWIPGARATFGPRYSAFLTDVTVILLIHAIVSIAAGPAFRAIAESSIFEVPGLGLSDLVAQIALAPLVPVVALVYFSLTEGKRGATVGKKVVGIRVQKADGTPAGYRRATVRALVLWGPLVLLYVTALAPLSVLVQRLNNLGAALFVLVWSLNILLALFWSERRGIHDLVAGTEVVRK